MLRKKVSDEIYKVFSVLGNKQAVGVISRAYRDKVIKTVKNDTLKKLINKRLISVVEYEQSYSVSLTDLGMFFAEIIMELDNKIYNPVGVNKMLKVKYSRLDAKELMDKSLDEKILKLQSTLALMLRDFNVIMDVNYNTQSNEFKLLKRMLDKAVFEFPFNHKSKTKHKISCKMIEKNPEIYDEWAVNGCYNPKALVSYPFAIWTREDIDKYWDKIKDL